MNRKWMLSRCSFENVKLAGVRYCIHCGAACSDSVDDECPGCGENPDK